jgi:hypothetical protein
MPGFPYCADRTGQCSLSLQMSTGRAIAPAVARSLRRKRLHWQQLAHRPLRANVLQSDSLLEFQGLPNSYDRSSCPIKRAYAADRRRDIDSVRQSRCTKLHRPVSASRTETNRRQPVGILQGCTLDLPEDSTMSCPGSALPRGRAEGGWSDCICQAPINILRTAKPASKRTAPRAKIATSCRHLSLRLLPPPRCPLANSIKSSSSCSSTGKQSSFLVA